MILGESWAQALIALTGVCALIISTWAVWLLKRTLEATRATVKAANRTADEAKRIGEAQVRAYLNITSIKFSDPKIHIQGTGFKNYFLEIMISNTGNSPARDAIINFDTEYRHNIQTKEITQKKLSHARHFTLGAGASTIIKTIVLFYLDDNQHLYVGKNSPDRATNAILYVVGDLSFTDCFDIRRTFSWSFYVRSEFLIAGYLTSDFVVLGDDTSILTLDHITAEKKLSLAE